MPPSTDRLREYLGSDEPLEAVYTATLAQRSARKRVTLGLTDRRLFYLADGGSFGNIEYGAIRTVRSQPRTRRSYCLEDWRLVVGVGVLVALLGFLAVVGSTSALSAPFLGLATVIGLVTAEYVRRHAEGVGWSRNGRLEERLGEHDIEGALRRFRRDGTGRADLPQVLFLGSALLAVSSFVGLVVLAASGYAVLGALALVAGPGLVDYGYRYRDAFAGFEITRHRETVVHVSTDDRTLQLRIDSSADLPRQISRLVCTGTGSRADGTMR
jgi:hypothetical protein